MRKALQTALRNIIAYGDTDILPYPIENCVFADKQNEILDLLTVVDREFDDSIIKMPVYRERCLSVTGYQGFRQATQVDPVWNAYLLALVIKIGHDIETARIPKEDKVLFSYRFAPSEDDHSLFDKDFGWRAFQKVSVERAREHTHVLICDISDFYPRVYHHRLENALRQATSDTEAVQRIMRILSEVAGGVSYGLPIGGPAARLLSELLLSSVDKLLRANQVTFCRFVDDYHIFCDSREEAHRNLILLSETLLENEGLSLQKSKTRTVTLDEFLANSEFYDDEDLTEDEARSRAFLSLYLHYDPYSPTADEDYDTLKRELSRFDVVGMLTKEMKKTRIDQAITKKLIQAVRVLSPIVKEQTVLSVIENLDVLYPVFPEGLMLIKGVLAELSTATQAKVFSALRGLIQKDSYITQVAVNRAFAVRVLARDMSSEADTVLNAIYNHTTSMLIKRDVILSMAARRGTYWISDKRKQYDGLMPWEKRAILVASYVLGDEGKHWRDNVKSRLNPIELLMLEWAGDKKSQGRFEIPV